MILSQLWFIPFVTLPQQECKYWDECVWVCWPDCKPEGPLFSAEFVCLCACLSVYVSVCIWPALLPFNVNRFWRILVTRTLLWSSLAATIMVQIGCRGTAWRLFENFKKFWKVTEFEFQNSAPSFFAFVSLVYCKKKFGLDSNKSSGGDRFWSLPLSVCVSLTGISSDTSTLQRLLILTKLGHKDPTLV